MEETHGVDLLGTVVLVVGFAGLALAARVELSADKGGIANLELGHGRSDSGNIASDLVSRDERVLDVAPATGEGVDCGRTEVSGGREERKGGTRTVGRADTAEFDLDLDEVVAELGRLVLLDLRGRKETSTRRR